MSTSHIEVESMAFPARFATFFVNGDDSGLNSSDREEANDCLDLIAFEYGKRAYIVGCGDNTFFARYKGLTTEMITYTIHVIVE